MHSLSTVLIREEDRVQYLVYYVSKAVHDTELLYFPTEKLAYALIMPGRKLPPYFLEHP